MAEWFKVLVLKTNVFNKIPWVQIPLYPNGVITQLARVVVLHTKGYQFKSGLLQIIFSSLMV